MPIYNVECLACETSFEAWAKIKNRKQLRCPACGGKTRLVISCTGQPVVYNYFSENLNAFITGPAQRRAIMREKGYEEK